jgi:NADH-quinone oxidoreductase subunit L
MIIAMSIYSDIRLSIFKHIECSDSYLFIGWGIIIAAWSKSAQFGLNGWLFDAMVGPTPVSSLLHSATLVLAGIIVMIKCWWFLGLISSISIYCGLLGVVTSIFSSLGAIYYIIL